MPKGYTPLGVIHFWGSLLIVSGSVLTEMELAAPPSTRGQSTGLCKKNCWCQVERKVQPGYSQPKPAMSGWCLTKRSLLYAQRCTCRKRECRMWLVNKVEICLRKSGFVDYKWSNKKGQDMQSLVPLNIGIHCRLFLFSEWPTPEPMSFACRERGILHVAY